MLRSWARPSPRHNAKRQRGARLMHGYGTSRGRVWLRPSLPLCAKGGVQPRAGGTTALRPKRERPDLRRRARSQAGAQARCRSVGTPASSKASMFPSVADKPATTRGGRTNLRRGDVRRSSASLEIMPGPGSAKRRLQANDRFSGSQARLRTRAVAFPRVACATASRKKHEPKARFSWSRRGTVG